uniref:E3 ubiquitin-protein ligase listerin n=1 Tax=Cucumis melo TaxID=3656 RepID=A0A9I9DLL5_CUCME
MGRPKGDGARSKARPSSSSLAASLLPSDSAANAAGFGGFLGSYRLDSSLTGDDAAPFSDIDSEVAQHLKRLSRKDPTTKLKALASLSEILKQKSGKDVASIIPQWVFEYKKLLMDYNRDVRRATHDTMTNLVMAAGREIAPHLKSLMGPWWFSQFDSVSEVSQSAMQSLQAAFPAQEKRVDALVLCTTEIFIYLEENLKLTPDTLSDKLVAKDELEEMHQQVISSSLLALATLIDVLVSGRSERSGTGKSSGETKHTSMSRSRETAISFAEKLFTEHKYFIDLLKSKSNIVRSATYSVMRSLVKNIPHAFKEQNMKTIAGSILGAFQEKDPSCHSPMWDAVLLFSKRLPNCWTYVNVQKTVLNRFWNFLRNGCFGSQKISYPTLILFLDTVPPCAVGGEKFLLDFFENLWVGRNPFHSSSTERLAFFQAFKECFLWGIQNASSFCNGDDFVHFQVTLIDAILVKLLWKDYLHVQCLKNQDRVFSEDAPLNNKMTEDLPSTKYPMSYLQDLRKCIVEILSSIHLAKHDLLSVFAMEFQKNCIDMFQLTDNVGVASETIEQIIGFILELEQLSMDKDDTWLLVHLVGPTLANTFPIIQSLDSLDGVRLLSAAVSVFGPRKIVRELFINNNGMSSTKFSGVEAQDLEARQFMQVFNDIFVPWCLQGNNSSSSAQLDLLLALIDDEHFSDQWHSVISYSTNLNHTEVVLESMNSESLAVLAKLLNRVRGKITNSDARKVTHTWQRANLGNWHHEHLESAAIAIAQSHAPIRSSFTDFLCSVLGGSVQNDCSSFVSRDALIAIFEALFQKLVSFLLHSPFTWARNSCSLLISRPDSPEKIFPKYTSSEVVVMANFALEVLDRCIFCLYNLGEENYLLPSILATIYAIDWDCSMEGKQDDVLDEKFKEESKARLLFGESVRALRQKITDQFWKSCRTHNRKKYGSILIQFIRSAIFSEDSEEIVSLCLQWMLEILDHISQDQFEEQYMLDQLLIKNDTWPFWIAPDFMAPNEFAASNTKNIGLDIHISGNHKFISLISMFMSKIGLEKLFSGQVENSSPCISKMTKNEVTSRAWLVAEILCTWKWPGGNARGSFLPLFCAYVKRSCSHESLLDSTFNMLLDGALLYSSRAAQSLINIWPYPVSLLEDIQEPFLRALASLLFSLLKENIWGRDKASSQFELLVSRLFIGEAVNIDCLRILPLILSYLVRPMCERNSTFDDCGSCSGDSLMENTFQRTTEGWLQRVLLFPSLNEWQLGQDMEYWLLLVISCYPFSCSIGGLQTLKLDRNISTEEGSLLLELFRKQRKASSRSPAVNHAPWVQMLLSELMVVSVGYCWKQFSHEDWEFLLFQLMSWIQSAVVIMEEIAESVNDIIVKSSTAMDLNEILEKLEQSVLILDPIPFCISRNALLSFSLFDGSLGLHGLKDMESSSPQQFDKLNHVNDRIVEGILRMFFCTGISEAIAYSFSDKAASIISSSRLELPYFWDLIASSVTKSSKDARERAVKSIEFWGLSKGPVSSLYGILFSPKPIPSLQYAAYVMLSTEPISNSAIIRENTSCYLDYDITTEQRSTQVDFSSEYNVLLKEEILCMIEKLPDDVFEMELIAQERVNIYLAWSLLLSHLWSLPPSSSARERLVQYIQNSASSRILDCLFQHIPVEGMALQKRKDTELPAGLSEAATAANQAITTGSLLFSVEFLWPIEPVKLASFAGAIFGLMLRVLPAYVRGWFSDLRDRSKSSVLESFTKAWCSPSIIANELSQIKKAEFADENFSVVVSKSANEVIATYTKDETGMDLVIRLPSSYPLRHVDVDCMRSLGISEVKQRKWLLSMMSFVRNQNGALAEAIRIWKRNFDKEFEGVEECPICYSVIHTVNHSIPRLACKTCKHKFHSACLYKWFSTSHKSTCPLCQSPF